MTTTDIGLATDRQSEAIRPFAVDFSQADLDDLRRRVEATRWPERETVDDTSQGVQLETVTQLAARWREGYDWRAVQDRLNELPQFVTEIDGLDIHFIHVKSPHEHALPMIVTHGWPGSVIEQLKIVGPLTDPTAHGAAAGDAFDLVIPSLPGHGFSGKPKTTGWDPDSRRPRLDRTDEPTRLRTLRRAGWRLGQCGHRADGPAEATGTRRNPHEHARHSPGLDPDGPDQWRRAAVGSLPRGAGSVGSAGVLLRARPRPTPRRWATGLRPCTPSRTRRSALRRGCSTTMPAATT